MFNNLKNLLPQAIQRAGIQKQMNAWEICVLWETVLDKIFPAAVKKTKAISFKDKTLKIAVLSSVWAQELEFKKHEIIEAVNKEVGKNVLERIYFES